MEKKVMLQFETHLFINLKWTDSNAYSLILVLQQLQLTRNSKIWLDVLKKVKKARLPKDQSGIAVMKLQSINDAV